MKKKYVLISGHHTSSVANSKQKSYIYSSFASRVSQPTVHSSAHPFTDSTFQKPSSTFRTFPSLTLYENNHASPAHLHPRRRYYRGVYPINVWFFGEVLIVLDSDPRRTAEDVQDREDPTHRLPQGTAVQARSPAERERTALQRCAQGRSRSPRF